LKIFVFDEAVQAFAMYIQGLDLSAAWKMSMGIGYGVNIVAWRFQLARRVLAGSYPAFQRRNLNCINVS
jgi:hypothetical protein